MAFTSEIKSSVRPHLNLFNHSVDLFSNFYLKCSDSACTFVALQFLAQGANKMLLFDFYCFGFKSVNLILKNGENERTEKSCMIQAHIGV